MPDLKNDEWEALIAAAMAQACDPRVPVETAAILLRAVEKIELELAEHE